MTMDRSRSDSLSVLLSSSFVICMDLRIINIMWENILVRNNTKHFQYKFRDVKSQKVCEQCGDGTNISYVSSILVHIYFEF